jgi:hypothetical protein
MVFCNAYPAHFHALSQRARKKFRGPLQCRDMPQVEASQNI